LPCLPTLSVGFVGRSHLPKVKMKKQYKTRGIILKRQNFFETDRLLTIYTQDFGKIKAIAKGVRKPLSRLSGHVELFYLTDFVVSKGRNLDIITSADMVEKFGNLRQSKEVTNYTYYISELVHRLIQEDLANQKIFDLLKKTFFNLNAKNTEKMVCYFELKLFDILGHKPEVGKCVLCSGEISQKKNSFDYQDGGIVCNRCLGNRTQAIAVDKNLIKLLRIIERQNLDFFARIQINQKIINCLRECIKQIRHTVLEDELKSEKYI